MKRERWYYPGRAPVVLASASPRRVKLLRQVGLSFTVVDPGPDRAWPQQMTPRNGVRALALEKAQRVAARRAKSVVIGADTVVVARGLVLGKPADDEAALTMLRRLHGRTHEVWTGVAVVRGRERRSASVCTRVQFARMTDSEMVAYVKTGEPLDKAGAYAIQGRAAAFVKRVEGDYSTVVGLPLNTLRTIMREFA